MEKLSLLDKLICSVVGFMGLLAAVLGFVAEAKRDPGHTPELIEGGKACLSPKSHATLWAIVSTLLLLVAQLIVNGAARFVCCGGSYRSDWKKTIAIICFVLSWITFVSAIGLFIHGIIRSAQRERTTNISTDIPSVEVTCYFEPYAVKSGVFVGGSFLTLTSVTLGIIYYILTSEGRKMEKPIQNQNNFAMT